MGVNEENEHGLRRWL